MLYLYVYTQLSWALLSPVMASTCTSMPMILRSTSTLRPGTLSHCSSRQMSRRYQGLTEGQPTPAEPHQDSGYVVGFSTAAAEVPVASTHINVSETAHDLVVSCQLPLSARWPQCGYQLRQLQPLVRSMSTEVVKTLVHVLISCHLGPGLLQLSVSRHHRRYDEPVSPGAKGVLCASIYIP